MSNNMTKLFVTICILFISITGYAQTAIQELEEKLSAAGPEQKFAILLELIEMTGKDNPESGIEYALQALEVLKESGENDQKKQILITLGDLQYRTADFNSAILSFKQALEIAVSGSENNSAAKINEKLGRSYRKIHDIQSAVSCYNEAIRFYQNEQDYYNEANTYETIGIIYSRDSNYSQALDHFRKSLDIRNHLGDQKTVAKSLNNLGVVYWNIRDSEKAIDYYFRSLRIKEALNDRKGVASTYTNLGIIYRNTGEYEKALDCYSKSLEIRKRLDPDNSSSISLNYNNIGVVYWNMEEYEKALEYYNNALDMERKRADNRSAARTLNNISIVYKDRGDFNTARKYMTESLEIRKKLNDRKGIASVLNNMAFVNLEQNVRRNTLSYINQSMSIADSLGIKDVIRNNYRAYMQYYDLVEDYENAFRYSKLFYSMEDNLESEKTKLLVNNLHVKYDVAKKDNEIALLTEKDQYQSLVIVHLIIGLVCFIILFAIIFKIYSDRVKISKMLNTVINNLPHPFYIVDAKQYLLEYSNSALKDEYLFNTNLHPEENYPLGDTSKSPKYMKTINIDAVIRTKKRHVAEFSFLDRDGVKRYYESHSFPVLNNSGEVVKVMEYSFDISERKQADEKYIELQKQIYRTERLAAIGRLSASVAHEINNPLQAIVDNIDYVEHGLSDDFAEATSLDQVKIGVERITKTVRQLLDINRPNIEAKEFISVNKLLNSTIDFLKNQLMINKIEVIKELCIDETKILAIHQELFQVFLNILLNSIDAMIFGGTLKIKTYTDSSKVHIIIEDSGIGIAEENIEKIFEPFYTTKVEMLGMGLGLTTAKSIIESFNGSIEVESELGKGTSVNMSFFLI